MRSSVKPEHIFVRSPDAEARLYVEIVRSSTLTAFYTLHLPPGHCPVQTGRPATAPVAAGRAIRTATTLGLAARTAGPAGAPRTRRSGRPDSRLPAALARRCPLVCTSRAMLMRTPPCSRLWRCVKERVAMIQQRAVSFCGTVSAGALTVHAAASRCPVTMCPATARYAIPPATCTQLRCAGSRVEPQRQPQP